MGEGRLISQAKYAGARKGQRFSIVGSSVVDCFICCCCLGEGEAENGGKRSEVRVNRNEKKRARGREAALLVNIKSLQAAGRVIGWTGVSIESRPVTG